MLKRNSMRFVSIILLGATMIFFSACENSTSTDEQTKINKQTIEVQSSDKGVFVEIQYAKDSITLTETPWKKGLSCLEALQQVSRVETRPSGKYVFVTSIDTFKGTKGHTVWYYKLNGKSGNLLATNQNTIAGDTITWVYKQDICSTKTGHCK